MLFRRWRNFRQPCLKRRASARWILAAMLLVSQGLSAQLSDPWADSVVVFEPGTGQSFGQDPEYFPRNVLGPPDTTATPTVGSADPNEILSLGLGGRIVLAFTDNWIIDGPGADFTVFENAFIRQFGPKQGLPFAEPARVAVSADGVHFVAFPFDSLTLEGLAGVTPTNGAADPTNPDSSGGDSFDLADVGLDTVRFVELLDVTAIIKDNPEHPYWDPTLSGFDLDAVVAVNSAPVVPTGVRRNSVPQRFTMNVYPNPVSRSRTSASLHLNLTRSGEVVLTLYNLLGRQVRPKKQMRLAAGAHRWTIPIHNLPAGVYFVRLQIDRDIVVQKLQIVP